MRGKIFVWLLAAAWLTTATPAKVQQPKKVARIGFLSALSPTVVSDRVEAFRQGLRELGYVEGKNIIIDWRYAQGKTERLPDLAAELVRLIVDVIVTGGAAVNRFAKEATHTIPIILAFGNDPVGYGFEASIARQGGIIEGLSTEYPG